MVELTAGAVAAPAPGGSGGDPLFSVVLAVWNRADVVADAVRSVLAQSDGGFELIVVDDGSEDGLDAALAAVREPRVSVLRTAHRGVSAARNAGLAAARNPYVAFIDSDNLWRPTFLFEMRRALAAIDPPAEAAYCLARVHVHGAARAIARAGATGDRFSLRRLAQENFIDLNCFVLARRLAARLGGFDESLSRFVDWDFILRAGLRTEPVFVPEVLVDYRFGVCPNAITLTQPGEPAAGKIRAAAARRLGPLEVRHDGVTYTWACVTDRKYDNWVRLRQPLAADEHDSPGYPWLLQVEPSSACNLGCRLCPVADGKLGRAPRHLGLAEFGALVDDMQDYLLLLVLWDWGEPLMNPRLPEMVRLASERDIRTVTSTNAHLLARPGLAASLMEAGLSTLIVAIDAPEEDAYASFRRGGTLAGALAGLRRAVAEKRRLGARTLVVMRTVVTRQNEGSLGRLRALAREAGADHFSVKTLNPSCGEDDDDGALVPLAPEFRRYAYHPGTWQRVRTNQPCEYPWRQANVHADGTVVPCYRDFGASMPVGSIAEEPFSQIWRGAAFQQVRRRIRESQQQLEPCRTCGVNFQLARPGWLIRLPGTAESALAPVPPAPMRAESSVNDELASLAVALSDRTRRLEALERSLTWRATAPVRAVLDAARRGLRRRG